MRRNTEFENRVTYATPELEVISLQGADVITASGMKGSFEGTEHDIEDLYGW